MTVSKSDATNAQIQAIVASDLETFIGEIWDSLVED